MSDQKIYTKTEISKILSKASEIQTQKDLYGDQEGLTENELIQLAKEVGIDKNSLLEAIQVNNEPNLDTSYNWIRATSRVQQIVNVDGTFNDEEWEEIVQEIRKVTGGIGKINRVGKSFEWEQRRSDIGYKHFSFTPGNNKTKIQMVSSWGPLKLFSSMMSFFFGFIVVLLSLKSPLGKDTAVLLAPLGGLLGLLTSRFILKSYYETQKVQLSGIIKLIANKLRPKPAIKIEEEEVYDLDQTLSSSPKKNIKS